MEIAVKCYSVKLSFSVYKVVVAAAMSVAVVIAFFLYLLLKVEMKNISNNFLCKIKKDLFAHFFYLQILN